MAQTNHDLLDRAIVNIKEFTVPQEEALKVQVGGNHYKDMKIQPVEFCHANNIPYVEATVIKYICRWRKKDGIKDLEKAKHFIDLLIELENKNGRTTA